MTTHTCPRCGLTYNYTDAEPVSKQYVQNCDCCDKAEPAPEPNARAATGDAAATPARHWFCKALFDSGSERWYYIPAIDRGLIECGDLIITSVSNTDVDRRSRWKDPSPDMERILFARVVKIDHFPPEHFKQRVMPYVLRIPASEYERGLQEYIQAKKDMEYQTNVRDALKKKIDATPFEILARAVATIDDEALKLYSELR